MKEKYIFFTLLLISLVMLIGSALGKAERGEITPKEKRLERKLKQLKQRKHILPEKINMDKVQDLVAFSHYERMLTRSPFFKVEARRVQAATGKIQMTPVEDLTPVFVYKGKIIVGSRLLVIIEQTRSGEVFMSAKGERVDGYKVLDITDTEVILSKKGAENIVLKTSEMP